MRQASTGRVLKEPKDKSKAPWSTKKKKKKEELFHANYVDSKYKILNLLTPLLKNDII